MDETVEVWAESVRAGYAIVLISFEEHQIVSTPAFDKGEVRVFGRAEMDPERWDFDESATRLVGPVEQPTPGATRLKLEAQFRDRRKVGVLVELTS